MGSLRASMLVVWSSAMVLMTAIATDFAMGGEKVMVLVFWLVIWLNVLTAVVWESRSVTEMATFSFALLACQMALPLVQSSGLEPGSALAVLMV